MGKLIFLLISIVISGILIYVIPMGLTRKEKNIVIITAVTLGSFGLISMKVADLWQVLSLIVLLGACSSYIIVNRFSSSKGLIPLKERLHTNIDEDSFILHDSMKDIPEKKELSALKVLPVINYKTELVEEPQIFADDDISFLDHRNGDHIPHVEWVKPADSMEMDDLLANQENEKAYASTHS